MSDEIPGRLGAREQLHEHTIGSTQLRLVRGDITEQEVDAIVNAANAQLAGGGGVDGAIHRAGGPSIMAECDEIRRARGGCPTGDAVRTTAGDLPAEMVVHAVGPRWAGGDQGEFVALEKAYVRSLEEASAGEARSVAFPSISTGAYGFPIDRAAQVALVTVARWVSEHPDALDEVRWVLFADDDLRVYAEELADLVTTKLG